MFRCLEKVTLNNSSEVFRSAQEVSRSHALRGNACLDAPRPATRMTTWEDLVQLIVQQTN